jgi:RNA polymerase sigma factor (sigma-70 family)
LAGTYSDIHKDIIEECKQGSAKSQFKLYKLYSKAMFNICCRMMNSVEEAEDVLQEAFTDAFRNLEKFRYESSFGAWLKRIVINRCINALKSKKAELMLHEDMISYDSIEEEKVDEGELQLSVQKIRQAVSKLSDGYRLVFTLYSFEGYDHTEISQILGISESTSKSQYMRAKQKIKEMLIEKSSSKFRYNILV